MFQPLPQRPHKVWVHEDRAKRQSGAQSSKEVIFVDKSDEVFTIQARRCKRCGGLLTSSQGIRDGYGPCCLKKIQEERARKEMEKYQCSLFDADGTEGDGNGN